MVQVTTSIPLLFKRQALTQAYHIVVNTLGKQLIGGRDMFNWFKKEKPFSGFGGFGGGGLGLLGAVGGIEVSYLVIAGGGGGRGRGGGGGAGGYRTNYTLKLLVVQELLLK